MDHQNLKALIKDLVETFGPSGFEDPVRTLIEPLVEPFADELFVDALGNLVVHKKGNGHGQRIMIAAHMDEIGVMVTHITQEGFLHFTNLGFVFPATMMGSRLQFASGSEGIIYHESGYARSDPTTLEQHFIDVGATSKENCDIKVGDAAVFKREFRAQGNRLTAKSMDDRIGCVVAIETLRSLDSSPHDLYFVFSVQEEVGTRGAMAAANGILPDISIAIDVTPADDVPDIKKVSIELGKGPAIKVKDSGMISHGGLVRAFRQSAQEAQIPFQLEVLLRGSTDARSMQIAGPGSAAGCISIPCRYVHSQSETVDIEDVINAIELLTHFLSKPISL